MVNAPLDPGYGREGGSRRAHLVELLAAAWLSQLATLTDEDIETLTALSRSRTEPARWVSRAAVLLDYRENPSFLLQ